MEVYASITMQSKEQKHITITNKSTLTIEVVTISE
jgi:hypothetical protein